ncbi:MAG TPA: hypothetical protein VF403_13690 [Kofleriaceae bacterium]
MRALVVALLLASCQKTDAPAPPPPQPVAPVAVKADATVAVVVDAAVAVAAPDAVAVPDAEPDPTSILDTEAIGGLKMGADEKAIIAVLGAPKHKDKAEQEGATLDYVSEWSWPTASINMVSDTGKPPWTARLISISKTSTLETTQHIHLGSTRADVEKAYKRSDEDDAKPDQFLVGSVYGGLLFELKKDRVVTISMGPFAF